jgi:DNA (cytosine-5)-methyltransferase 1
MTPPTPDALRQARKAAGLTQPQAAELIHCGPDAWASWETGRREMHPAMWELFLIKTKTQA